jgi:hypothetical protein
MVQVKNIKTKLPPLQINIRFWGRLAAIAAVIGALYANGATLYVILGIYLGYKILRLVMRLFKLILSIVFTVISVGILVIIILFLIT